MRRIPLSGALGPARRALLVPPSRRPTAPRAQASSLLTPTQVSPCRSSLDLTLVSALLSSHRRRPASALASSDVPSFCSPSKSRGKSETSFRASFSATQQAAFRIWPSRASLSESSASPAPQPHLSAGPVFLATPPHWTVPSNNPLYPIPAATAATAALVLPPRAACENTTTAPLHPDGNGHRRPAHAITSLSPAEGRSVCLANRRALYTSRSYTATSGKPSPPITGLALTPTQWSPSHSHPPSSRPP